MRQPPNILLIGDEAARIARFRETLSRTACVDQAEDLPQALKRLALNDYETVITDWRFHFGTWREALRNIGDLYPDLPVIVISDSIEVGRGSLFRREAIAAGAFDLLSSDCAEFEMLSLAEQAVASARARALLATA